MLTSKLQHLSLLLFFICTTFVACSNGHHENYQAKREEMIKKHVIWRGITDESIVKAFNEVPREHFVLPEYKKDAYEDLEVPIGENQTLDRPYEDALILKALALKPGDKVLEVGTGSGYLASLMSKIADEVYTIEILNPLAESARKRVAELHYKNVTVKSGDGFIGWQEHAPFDAIILTCSPDEVPPALPEQLREGGRVVLPLGSDKKFQELLLYEKQNGKLVLKQRIAPAEFVPMEGEIRKK
ncbi:MAG: protein-L-isoaspartate O-methyltransferase [Deltaproteobacteria bacterium CG11_big_fil_rev_8_21_14_0_20_42_23]|nr:MAG: protein-L-isoaspartate O-methyltransferase [Deltaproteobacteria bacterium CG11_big_fil_rev_8_21_14_0_20_42_23]PJC63794.1 MAG: protein-L-isoaspartate O-methyltransferase [Deltaproteobacteria bacterium CG_4_9_14_0_2_um_filter_42_21]